MIYMQLMIFLLVKKTKILLIQLIDIQVLGLVSYVKEKLHL